jgi:hypothetical protein
VGKSFQLERSFPAQYATAANKEITESEYYKKHISRDKKIRFLSCPEVKFLKKESMNIYGKFLRNLSLGNRRRFAVPEVTQSFDDIKYAQVKMNL